MSFQSDFYITPEEEQRRDAIASERERQTREQVKARLRQSIAEIGEQLPPIDADCKRLTRLIGERQEEINSLQQKISQGGVSVEQAGEVSASVERFARAESRSSAKNLGENRSRAQTGIGTKGHDDSGFAHSARAVASRGLGGLNVARDVFSRGCPSVSVFSSQISTGLSEREGLKT